MDHSEIINDAFTNGLNANVKKAIIEQIRHAATQQSMSENVPEGGIYPFMPTGAILKMYQMLMGNDRQYVFNAPKSILPNSSPDTDVLNVWCAFVNGLDTPNLRKLTDAFIWKKSMADLEQYGLARVLIDIVVSIKFTRVRNGLILFDHKSLLNRDCINPFVIDDIFDIFDELSAPDECYCLIAFILTRFGGWFPVDYHSACKYADL